MSIRHKFYVKVYDADMNEHIFGPIEVEIKPSDKLGWAAIVDEEKEATECVKADLQCSLSYFPSNASPEP